MPRPERRPRRDRRVITRRRRVLVVSCGYTEDAYLRGLARSIGDLPIDLTLKPCAVAPDQVVEYAKRLADHHNGDFDEIWCVVDVDDYNISIGATKAVEVRAEFVVSNPCFELWLLLHFEPRTGHLAKCKDAERLVRKHLPGYQKAKLTFTDFEAGLANACDRAKYLERGGGTNYPNPSTGVWRLVERIMERKAEK